MSEDEKNESKFYNVNAYYEVYKNTQRRRGRLGRFVGKFTGFLDAIQGLFVSLMFFPLTIGTFLAVVYGASMGPIGFIAIFGSIMGGLTLFVERKVGKSLQVGHYSLLKGAVATAAAFGVTMGFLFLLLFLGKL